MKSVLQFKHKSSERVSNQVVDRYDCNSSIRKYSNFNEYLGIRYCTFFFITWLLCRKLRHAAQTHLVSGSDGGYSNVWNGISDCAYSHKVSYKLASYICNIAAHLRGC